MAEIEKLASMAADANIVRAVHALPGGSSFVAFIQRETANYWAARDDDDDSGLIKWMQDRWSGAQRAWAADVAIVTGDALQRPEVEAPDREAILAAAEALEAEAEERRTMHPSHMQTLFAALIARRSPYVVEIEKEMVVYQRLAGSAGAAENFNVHLDLHRKDLRPLFRSEIQKVIREARGA